MQQISSSRRLFRLIRACIIVLFVSAAFFSCFVFLSAYLKIETITVSGTDAEELRGLHTYYNKNLLLLSSKQTEEMLLVQNPQLKSVSIQKKFPNQLTISVTRQPVLAQMEMNTGFVFLSEAGKILQKSRTKDGTLPLIHYYEKINYTAVSAGEDIGYKEITTSLHFLKKLTDFGYQTNTIDIGGPDMLLFTIGSKKIFFTTEKDSTTQEYELTEILKQFKIEGKEFTSLDVRFEKPVIQF